MLRKNIKTDVYVISVNMNDFIPYIDRLKVQKEKFGFKMERKLFIFKKEGFHE